MAQPRQPDAVAVRSGRPDDIAAVMAIDATVTGLAKPDYWNALFDADGALAGDSRVFPAGDSRHFIVAEDGAGRVIGFIIGEVRAWEFGSPPCGWVFAISVDPASRQAGVGTGLLAAITDRFRDAGVERVRTMISRGNHQLMTFFRGHGMMAGPYIQLETELG